MTLWLGKGKKDKQKEFEFEFYVSDKSDPQVNLIAPDPATVQRRDTC